MSYDRYKYTAASTSDHSTLPSISVDDLPSNVSLIDAKSLELDEDVLGQGHYGKVMLGVFRDVNSRKQLSFIMMTKSPAAAFAYIGKVYPRVVNLRKSMLVAVKVMLKDTLRGRLDLVEEIRVTAQLCHPNLITLIGASIIDGKPAAVLERMKTDLLKFLREKREQAGGEMTALMVHHELLLDITKQIASGMVYMSGRFLIHRDLAARNILVGGSDLPNSRLVVKIADFGLTRDSNKGSYQTSEATSLNFRWQPLEVLDNGMFSHASDVFSFGVMMWEIFSFGGQPHEGLKHEELQAFLRARKMLEPPVNCPDSMFSLMRECWHWNPDRRIRFLDLRGSLPTSLTPSPAI